MKNLKFNVCGLSIFPAFTEKIIADSKNYFNLSFEFSEEWSGFIKTAAISVNDKVYNCLIDNNGKIEAKNLPTFENGALKISVFGGDFLATEEVILTVHPSGYKKGVAPPNVPPEIYTQLTEEINEKTQKVMEAEKSVIMAEEAAEKAMAAASAVGDEIDGITVKDTSSNEDYIAKLRLVDGKPVIEYEEI
ncbi:MAG: hypothetical protein IKZ25_04210 [Clostridia bacterium]|nr:hypothetical protein [Clostridia bacterium]